MYMYMFINIYIAMLCSYIDVLNSPKKFMSAGKLPRSLRGFWLDIKYSAHTLVFLERIIANACSQYFSHVHINIIQPETFVSVFRIWVAVDGVSGKLGVEVIQSFLPRGNRRSSDGGQIVYFGAHEEL